MSRKGLGNNPMAAQMTSRQVRRAEAHNKGNRDVPPRAVLRMLNGNPSTLTPKGGRHA